jgi:hypothetical protein
MVAVPGALEPRCRRRPRARQTAPSRRLRPPIQDHERCRLAIYSGRKTGGAFDMRAPRESTLGLAALGKARDATRARYLCRSPHLRPEGVPY